jgi:hypothetical protein
VEPSLQMNPTTDSTLSQLLHLLTTVNPQNPSQFSLLQSALDNLSRQLVSDKDLRSFNEHSFFPLQRT